MTSRITGTEMEYPVVVRDFDGEGRPISHEEVRRSLDIRPYGLVHISDFMSNGARFYPDTGDRPEYATPEDATVEGTLANEIAGEYIVAETLEMARQRGLFENFSLNKRVIAAGTGNDDHTTWGYHENYACPRGDVALQPDRLATLGLHLATRNLYTGAGAVIPGIEGEESRFYLGQKTLNITQDFSTGTVTAKPLVNLRSEPLAAEYVRMHVTSGDANMSPWATRMKLGTTSLVLDLIEQGTDLTYLDVGDRRLHQLAQHTAADGSLRYPFELASGATITPAEIQYELMAHAQGLRDKIHLTNEDLATLDEWEQVCADISYDPSLAAECLKDRVDWAVKLAFIERQLQKRGETWRDETPKDIDLRYDLLDADQGIGMRLRGTLWKDWMPDQELVIERVTTPPSSTRASVRGAFVQEFAGEIGASVSWDSLGFPQHANRHPMPDPWDTTMYTQDGKRAA